MEMKEVFELCKKNLGCTVRYIKRLENGNYEAHEIKQKIITKYVLEIKDGKIKILSETEEKI